MNASLFNSAKWKEEGIRHANNDTNLLSQRNGNPDFSIFRNYTAFACCYGERETLYIFFALANIWRLLLCAFCNWRSE